MFLNRTIALAGLLPALLLGPLGCETMSEHKILTGTAIGTATGAAAGAIIGHQSGHSGTGALIGAATGAALGGGVGYLLDRQEKKFRRIHELEVERIKAERDAANDRVVVREHLVLRLSNEVLFERGSSALSPHGTQKLREIAQILRESPDSRVVVKGYASSEGSDSENQELSDRRARNVRNTLVSYGVNPGRITSMGLGESNPMGDNATLSGRAQNRRVEIEVYPEEGGGGRGGDRDVYEERRYEERERSYNEPEPDRGYVEREPAYEERAPVYEGREYSDRDGGYSERSTTERTYTRPDGSTYTEQRERTYQSERRYEREPAY